MESLRYKYQKGIRTEETIQANRVYQQNWVKNRGLPKIHGTNSTYNNYKCRCWPCIDAHRAAQRKLK